MKILEQVRAIIAEYDLKPIKLPDGHKNIYSFIREFPDEGKNYTSKINDDFLLFRYMPHIPKGWYGFAIGEPMVIEWTKILLRVLDLCVKQDPKFEIYQIKTKWGGIRFYCGSEAIEDINEVEALIENVLNDEALIY